jgi:predicted HTH domain antitoxin
MQRLAGRAVFTVGEREYQWDDVVLAAHLWGDMARLERGAKEALACLNRLDEIGDEVPESEIDSAADDWRYGRDLLSADDMQAWLDERHLDADEWFDYFQRSIARKRLSEEIDELTNAYDASREDVDVVVYGDATCSGTLGELAERLAGRAAIYDRVAEESGAARPAPCSEADLRAELDRLPVLVKEEGVLGIAREAVTDRAESIVCVTLCYEWFIDRVAAPAALEREIESHALEWTHVDCETVRFAAEETAREVVLLVREDGVPLAEAAEMAKSSVGKTRYLLEDVKPPLKDRLVGALPGELIGPLPSDDGVILVAVADRGEPSAEDPAIRERARDRIIRRTIQREIEKRVRWHERL